jgi:hypothetical protein
MQNVSLDVTLLFDLHYILGWLLAAVQPKKQLPRHSYLSSKCSKKWLQYFKIFRVCKECTNKL